MSRKSAVLALAAAISFLPALACRAQLSAQAEAAIGQLARSTLASSGVPSASIAIAEHGHIVYAQAFGLANVAGHIPARPDMAYPIGSISKQFTAQAILLLQQRGKLSIDDPVSKYFPNFTRANDITLRNLMTMTAGYEDYAPQDYIIPLWRESVDPGKNVTEWSTKPLDFEPGTEWQYSNTNYVILALIAQKVAGEPLMQFLRENIFAPLDLHGIFNTYAQRDQLQVTGYISYAMQPVRVQPLEGSGWSFGDGDLSMTASTLAMWDEDIAEHKLLTPESYTLFETPFTLKNGTKTSYALGIGVNEAQGHLVFSHGGEVGGFVAANELFPNDLGGLAIVVLTNEIAAPAAHDIQRGIAQILLPDLQASAPGSDPLVPELKTLLGELAQGSIDRSKLTANLNDYFSADVITDFKATLAPLGQVKSIKRAMSEPRGGMTYAVYEATFASGDTLTVSTYLMPNGKLEQLLLVGKN